MGYVDISIPSVSRFCWALFLVSIAVGDRKGKHVLIAENLNESTDCSGEERNDGDPSDKKRL